MSRKSILRTVLLTATWIPVVMTMREFVHVSQIKGKSMRPTLNPNDDSTDWVLVKLFRPRRRERDDIVLFRAPTDPNVIYCKRIKGLSNDALYLDNDSMVRQDKSHLTLVPNGHLWVEGDNTHSVDSRSFGPISDGLVIGKVMCVIWPPERWGTNLNRWVGRDILANHDSK
ncbi:similar to Saccharomyces cerevisiae YMR035W IMP2 Catalytic subunit of the mitochondrial inner membrane peptidase complex [Maudiozyma saulgeensis]|uniref:Mitochondrial inner membrane protease subunit 2 n=1 Tax=Maudiozyma saulgeensis TaxID=1789683 RepID=A0A1X7R941_9SACH|nr:similar to Saccharomyces cerevisiae YMR035W IMP2 Catalytic subunit of the mitochondrial inner membrane peptidase complex [Kazachstania saulgeensis]